MTPDFLLECSACGSEAVWDTDSIPPVGLPEVGHPVLWFCPSCGQEMRHTIVDLYVILTKLHHEICVISELDRDTVERVMAEVYRCRRQAADGSPTRFLDPAEEVEEVAEAAGVPLEVVEQISSAEAAWMLRRGYLVETSGDP
jgi:rubrerythrin